MHVARTRIQEDAMSQQARTPHQPVPQPSHDPQEAAQDWSPRSAEVQRDQVAAYDAMRARCPVAHDEYLGWTLFAHADVEAAALDAAGFSNHVSERHVAVPNGMDAPEHTAFRRINDRYFTPERMAAFRPTAHRVVAELVGELVERAGEAPSHVVEAAGEFAERFAMEITAAFMGWEQKYRAPLTAWVRRNREATLRQDREEIGRVALEFDGRIRQMLDERRGDAGRDAEGDPRDVTAELMRDVVDLPAGRRTMTDEELVSLIRNWTVGELSTIAACVGILVQFLAEHPQEQERLRRAPAAIPAAVEEILRLRDPLVSNRRVTTRPVEMGGRRLPGGARVTLNWTSANRDEAVFPEAREYRPGRDQSGNLVYGTGVHACPGAPLARLELRTLVEELLRATARIEPAGETANETYPVVGFTTVPVRVVGA